MIRTLLSAFVVAASAATLTAVGAAPAHAGTSNTSFHRLAGNPNCDDSNLRNRGRFVHTTDNLRSSDDCPDGWGADTEIALENGRSERCYNQGGDGTTRVCDFEFAEGLMGQILAISLDAGKFKSSGDPVLIFT